MSERHECEACDREFESRSPSVEHIYTIGLVD